MSDIETREESHQLLLAYARLEPAIPPAPTEPPSSRRRWRAYAVSAGALLVLVAGASLLAVQGRLAGPAVRKATIATPAGGSASPSIAVSRDRYVSLVAPDMDALLANRNGISAACSPAYYSAVVCRSAVAAVQRQVERVQADLDANPAPACLRQADVELRAALVAYRDGASQLLAGLDGGDQHRSAAGTAKLAEGDSLWTTANRLGQLAYCPPGANS